MPLAFTVTVKLQLASRLAASEAVQFTVFVPSGNADPEGGLQTTVTSGQLSVALTMKLTIADEAPSGAVTVMFAGQLMPGG